MRVVVIGVGRMGRRHIQVVKDLGLDLVGICDQNPESLNLALLEQGISPKYHFQDVPALLDRTHPDCVIVATTAPTHAAYTIAAAQTGARYVLCEKPMAISLAQCDEMLAVCEAQGARLAINHQMRFMEQYQLVKKWTQDASFGGLKSVTVVAGNLGMAMNSVHYFEMFRYLADEAPQEVTAWFSDEKVPNPRGPQFEDKAGSVRVTTASGKRFYLEMGADQGHGIKIVCGGPYGQIVLDEVATRMTVAVRKEEYRKEPSTRYGMPWEETTHSYQTDAAVSPTQAVLSALLKDQNPPDGEDGRRAVSVLVAAHVSHENGHIPISLKTAQLPRQREFPWA